MGYDATIRAIATSIIKVNQSLAFG